MTGGQAEDDVQPEAQGSMTGTQAETGAQPEREDYREVMEAARKAIEADDADALDRLQESEEGKALARAAEAEESGSVLYFPDGNEDGDGTGVGFYTFDECDCVQWYYGDYAQGKREGRGIWYYVSSQTEDGSLYQEVYEGDWKGDAPNGKGRQQIRSGGTVEADQEYKVKNGLFYGTYEIRDTLEDGTEVSGSYKLKKGKYETIPDAELEASHFEVPDGPHLAIAFLYDEFGTARSCKFIGAADATKGVKHFY